MSYLRERFCIADATPEGEMLLRNDAELQQAMDHYMMASVPHEVPLPWVNDMGRGSYSRVYNFKDMVALKFSNWETLTIPLRRRGGRPEDLYEQFAVLSAMKEHLYYKRDYITTPAQYFVSCLPNESSILAQELMTGWVTLANRMRAVYGGGPEDWERCQDIEAWTEGFHKRVRRSLGDFALNHLLKDLVRPDGRFHAGNVLVPFNAPLDTTTPLCIIDQPGTTAA